VRAQTGWPSARGGAARRAATGWGSAGTALLASAIHQYATRDGQAVERLLPASTDVLAAMPRAGFALSSRSCAAGSWSKTARTVQHQRQRASKRVAQAHFG
jgi:hypothetical protein